MILLASRTTKQILALFAAACILMSSANADVIFEDNFDADSIGIPATSLLNWDINAPSVDVVGPAAYGHLCNGNTAGHCLDMDGSPPGNGQITTKLGLDLAAGSYTFSFDYGNNTRNNNSLAWNIGTIADGIVFTGTANNNTYTNSINTFNLSSAAFGVFITFTGGGTEDAGGTVLDNVLLVGPAFSSVPEPSMLMLLGLGLLGLSNLRRRKARS